MKSKITGFFIVDLLVLFSFVQAKPVLVAVELNNKDLIKSWSSQDYQTYDFINNTAIAEVDIGQIPILETQGFQCSIIDDLPWSEKYFITKIPGALKINLPGRIIWQRDQIYLIKIPSDKLLDLFALHLEFQPLKKSVLPNRFWDQMIVDMVPISPYWDPFIQDIVDDVSTDSIMAYVQRLQDFRTRLVLSDSSYAASEWLRQKYSGWGYPTEFDSFYIDTSMASWGYWPDTGYERNVIATYNGSVNPSKIFIVCGHFDAVVWHDTALARLKAPGADDNASGTVAAMEAARIFRHYAWDPTIKFVGWAVEELGLYGSEHYARWADSLGLNIGGVVNADMIAYMDDAYLDCIIQRRSGAPTWLSDLFCQAGQLYTPALIIDPVISSGGSDWYPFGVLGYPSVGSMENSGSFFNPNYHDTSDLITTLSPALFTEITKVTVATMAILCSYPSVVQNLEVYDIGDGNRLKITWSGNPESDVIGYNVYWGRLSGIYTDTQFVAGIGSTCDTLTGLMQDSTYYVAVTAVDSDDHESYAAIEVAGMPRNIPLAPQGVTATPLISGIRIDWQQNQELDFAGYRVYRRINDDPEYDSMNVPLLSDTTFTNAPLSGANKYYYAVRAFDDDGNASPMSSETYGRPITLDQGILIVDETKNWTSGSYPHDTTQDKFYQYVLQDYRFTEYEYGTPDQKPVLADLGPYSTVVWFADDYIELMASGNVPDFKNYLDVGGNLWFMGWKPTGDLRANPNYPVNFNPGSFIYDYLYLSHAELSVMSDSFQGAKGQLGYPDIAVDPDKVPLPIWAGTMRYIESLTSVPPNQNIYTMDMKNNSSPFENAVCGVRHLGQDFKTVFLGFPIYFMNQEQARALGQKVMSDFGEPAGVAEKPGDRMPGLICKLYAPLPNPCKGMFKIRFALPDQQKVTIKLYDILGRAVKTIIDGKIEAGMNEVMVIPDDLPSGIYFVLLETRNYKETTKVLLLK